MTIKTATWLDIIPAIPLAKNVPIIMLGVLDCGIDAARSVTTEDETCVSRVLVLGGFVDCEGLRVDLDDPQGFGYALRWLHQARGMTGGEGPSVGGTLALRHWCGQTTDADRLELARALAEVVS